MRDFLIQGKKNEGISLERTRKSDIIILKSIIINTAVSHDPLLRVMRKNPFGTIPVVRTSHLKTNIEMKLNMEKVYQLQN